MTPADIATNLELREEGLWMARTPTRDVAYPPEAYESARWLEDHSFWFAHRAACLLDVLVRFPPPGVFFDVGGGCGYMARAIQQAGHAVVLVEPGLPGVRTARERGVRTVVAAPLEDAGFRDETLPAVGLFDVLEHMDPDTAFLGQLRRLMPSGGRLYLTVPAYRWLWAYDDVFARHRDRYTLGRLAGRLASVGFRVEYATYLFAPLPPAIFILRVLPSRLRIRRSVEMDRARREHAGSPGLGQRLLGRLLERERAAIRRGARVPFGSSCLVVARAEG